MKGEVFLQSYAKNFTALRSKTIYLYTYKKTVLALHLRDGFYNYIRIN